MAPAGAVSRARSALSSTIRTSKAVSATIRAASRRLSRSSAVTIGSRTRSSTVAPSARMKSRTRPRGPSSVSGSPGGRAASNARTSRSLAAAPTHRWWSYTRRTSSRARSRLRAVESGSSTVKACELRILRGAGSPTRSVGKPRSPSSRLGSRRSPALAAITVRSARRFRSRRRRPRWLRREGSATLGPEVTGGAGTRPTRVRVFGKHGVVASSATSPRVPEDARGRGDPEEPARWTRIPRYALRQIGLDQLHVGS